ncbi:MAG: hypothetical protein AAGF33_06455 [Pseudomonadota bacterium]
MTYATGIMFAVRAAFVLVEAARTRRDKRLSRLTIDYTFPEIEETEPVYQAYRIYNSGSNWTAESQYGSILQSYADLFEEGPGGQGLLFRLDAPPERKTRVITDLLDIPATDEACAQIPWMCEQQTLQQWGSSDVDRGDRIRLILGLSNIALDFLGTYTHRLGLRPRAQTIVAGLTSSVSGQMAALLTDGDMSGAGQKLGQHVLETMLETSLDLAETQAHLFSDEKPVQAIVSAAFGPLKELNEANRGQQFFSGVRLQRLRQTLRGPVAVNVLQSLHDNRRELFDGDYPKKGTAAGIVTDAFVEGMITDLHEFNDIRKVFTPDFVTRVYPKVLTAVGEAPEAFIPGTGQASQLGREFLSGIAGAVETELLESDPQLAQSIIELGFGLAQRHAGLYLERTTQDLLAKAAHRAGQEEADPWTVTQIRIASHIATQIIGQAGDGRLNLSGFQDMTERSFLMELVGIVADNVAENPSMLVGGSANPELTNIARGVAEFVANEHSNLLTRADWRRVAGKATALAMANPGRLFGLDHIDSETSLAGTLVQRILVVAHESLTDAVQGGLPGSRPPNRVLFGGTLVAVLEETLDLAASHSQLLSDIRKQDALIEFVRRLNSLVADPERGFAAGEWLRAFRLYATEAITKGTIEISDDEIVSAIRDLGRGLLPSLGVDIPQFLNDGPVHSTSSQSSASTSLEDEEVYYQPISARDASG